MFYIGIYIFWKLPLPILGIRIPISVTGSGCGCIAGICSTSGLSSAIFGHFWAVKVVFQSVSGDTWISNLFSCVYKIIK